MLQNRTTDEWRELLKGSPAAIVLDVGRTGTTAHYDMIVRDIVRMGLITAEIDGRRYLTNLGAEIFGLLVKDAEDDARVKTYRRDQDYEAAHNQLDLIGVPREDGHALTLQGRLDWLIYRLYGLDDVVEAARKLEPADRLKVMVAPERP